MTMTQIAHRIDSLHRRHPAPEPAWVQGEVRDLQRQLERRMICLALRKAAVYGRLWHRERRRQTAYPHRPCELHSPALWSAIEDVRQTLGHLLYDRSRMDRGVLI